MSAFELILIVLIAVGAFWAGYKIGRASALASPGRPDASSPPPVDTDDSEPLPGPHALPTRPRGAPPPASAGGDGDTAEDRAPPRNAPPRRSTTPPPASAGLMDKGDAEHSPKKSG